MGRPGSAGRHQATSGILCPGLRDRLLEAPGSRAITTFSGGE